MKAMESGWKLSNKGTHILLSKGKTTIRFDRVSRTKDGILCGVEMVPRIGETALDAADHESGGEGQGDSSSTANLPNNADQDQPRTQAADENKTDGDKKNDPKAAKQPKPKPTGYWEINRFHKIFGHASEEAMRATAKHCGWKLTGKLEACADCQMSNAQQKQVTCGLPITVMPART